MCLGEEIFLLFILSPHLELELFKKKFFFSFFFDTMDISNFDDEKFVLPRKSSACFSVQIKIDDRRYAFFLHAAARKRKFIRHLKYKCSKSSLIMEKTSNEKLDAENDSSGSRIFFKGLFCSSNKEFSIFFRDLTSKYFNAGFFLQIFEFVSICSVL